MNKKIENVAEQYKVLSAKMKELEAEIKPLEKELKEYADENRLDFDDNNQLKFANGVFIGVARSQKLTGAKADLLALAKKLEETYGENVYVKTSINDKAVIGEIADGNAPLIRLVERAKVQVSTVETYKIYA